MKTVILNNGLEVLAKETKHGIHALGYTNRTQAEKRLQTMGEGWFVGRGLGRPFYIAKKELN